MSSPVNYHIFLHLIYYTIIIQAIATVTFLSSYPPEIKQISITTASYKTDHSFFRQIILKYTDPDPKLWRQYAAPDVCQSNNNKQIRLYHLL